MIKLKNAAGTTALFPENQVAYMKGNGWTEVKPKEAIPKPNSTLPVVAKPLEPKEAE